MLDNFLSVVTEHLFILCLCLLEYVVINNSQLQEYVVIQFAILSSLICYNACMNTLCVWVIIFDETFGNSLHRIPWVNN